MSEILDRVAKAIDEVLGDDHESLSIEMGCGSIAAKLRAEAMTAAARIAIAAMREPTEAMARAGLAERADMEANADTAWDFRLAASDHHVWCAMIDEALK